MENGGLPSEFFSARGIPGDFRIRSGAPACAAACHPPRMGLLWAIPASKPVPHSHDSRTQTPSPCQLRHLQPGSGEGPAAAQAPPGQPGRRRAEETVQITPPGRALQVHGPWHGDREQGLLGCSAGPAPCCPCLPRSHRRGASIQRRNPPVPSHHARRCGGACTAGTGLCPGAAGRALPASPIPPSST